MALKSTICKATLNIADMNRHYYNEHNLTLAQHPSETELRMMSRLAVFALNANPELTFTKGISTDNEPDLWVKSLTGEVEYWIELGQPDEKRLRQMCGKAKQVKIYCYQGHSSEIWHRQIQETLHRFDNLCVYNLDAEAMKQLIPLCQRAMQLHANIQDNELMLGSNEHSVTIEVHQWYPKDPEC